MFGSPKTSATATATATKKRARRLSDFYSLWVVVVVVVATLCCKQAEAASDWFNCNFSLLPHNQFLCFCFFCATQILKKQKKKKKEMGKNYCNRTNMFYTERRHMLQLIIMPYAPSRGVPHATCRHMPQVALPVGATSSSKRNHFENLIKVYLILHKHTHTYTHTCICYTYTHIYLQRSDELFAL